MCHWRARQPQLTTVCQAWLALGAKVLVCKPANPEAEGIIDRLHGLPGTLLPARA
jgi:hypothetical protein